MVMEMYILTVDISKLVVILYNLAKYCHWGEFGKEYMESLLQLYVNLSQRTGGE